MPLDDQLVTMSEKQLWKAFVLQNLNFKFQPQTSTFLEGNFKMSER